MKKLKYILAILFFGLLLLDSFDMCFANPQKDSLQPMASSCIIQLQVEEAVTTSFFEFRVPQQKTFTKIVEPKVILLEWYIASIWQPPRIA